MHATEGPQKIAQRRARAFAGITMHFAPPVTILIACPFVQGMRNGAMVGVDALIGPPFIATQERRLGGTVAWSNV